MSNIIDGKRISQDILKEIKEEIIHYSHIGKPGLAMIQIGTRNDSNIYIRKKQEACQLVGIVSHIYNFDTTVTNNTVCALIKKLNEDMTVNGILVQLPIPNHLNNEKILSKISYLKDVDGFHARNMGNLAMEKRTPNFIPCTPLGCLELLKRTNITNGLNFIKRNGNSYSMSY